MPAASSRLSRQFVLFALVGAVATGAHMTTLALLVELGGWQPLPASCAGALAGALVSYILNYRHTFDSNRPHQTALPRFLVTAAIAFALNAALFAAFLHFLGLHYLYAQVLTTLMVLLFTFSAGRFWVF